LYVFYRLCIISSWGIAENILHGCSCGGPGGAWQLWVPGGSFVVGVISVFLCCLLLAVFGWLLLASLGKPSTQAMMFQDTIG